MAYGLIQRFVASHDVRASRWGRRRLRWPDWCCGRRPYLRVDPSALSEWFRMLLIPCWSSAGGHGVTFDAH